MKRATRIRWSVRRSDPQQMGRPRAPNTSQTVECVDNQDAMSLATRRTVILSG